MHAFETLTERRERQAREAIRRNAPAMRAMFWAGKAEGYQPDRRRAEPHALRVSFIPQ